MKALFLDLTVRVEALEEVTSQISIDIADLQETTDDFENRIQALESVISGRVSLYGSCKRLATLILNSKNFVLTVISHC